jgi:Tol biopolymer transport system component
VGDVGDQVFTVASDGTDLRQLTNGPGQGENTEPSWSPDGSRLSFVSRRNGYGQLFVMSADGADQQPLPCGAPSDVCEPDWAPDGERIVLGRSDHDEPGALVVLDLGSGVATQLTPGDLLDITPAWSPDGRLIAFGRRFGHPPGVYLIPAEGGEARFVAPGGDPSWSPAGDAIAYAYGAGLWLLPVDSFGRPTDRARPLACDGEANVGRSSWAPDGRRLVFEVQMASQASLPRRLRLVGVSGGEVQDLTDGSTPDWSPVWRLDGEPPRRKERDDETPRLAAQPTGISTRRERG